MAKGVLEHNPKLGYPLEHKGACGYGFGLLFSPNSSRPAVPTWGIWYCPLYPLVKIWTKQAKKQQEKEYKGAGSRANNQFQSDRLK
ncbi:hypothetical protein BHE74_00002246 [Ensete ventricosum]|nr:hypothetical protein BHE74_00002246 [Ensete ventricosum]RZS10765.1 hypothetical protein BHM03_00042030 [Ensete ventricosum]